MSKIAVLVDSSSYIAPADLAALNIYQINDPIMMGEQVFMKMRAGHHKRSSTHFNEQLNRL